MVRCALMNAFALTVVFLCVYRIPISRIPRESGCDFICIPLEADSQEKLSRKLVPVPSLRMNLNLPEIPHIYADFDLQTIELVDVEYTESDDIQIETDAESLAEISIPEQKQHAPSKALSEVEREKYTPPSYRDCPQPPYPAAFKYRPVECSVGVTIAVSADGMPESVEISEPATKVVFNEHTRRWILSRWKFSPAMRGDQPVAAPVHTTIRYTPG